MEINGTLVKDSQRRFTTFHSRHHQTGEVSRQRYRFLGMILHVMRHPSENPFWVCLCHVFALDQITVHYAEQGPLQSPRFLQQVEFLGRYGLFKYEKIKTVQVKHIIYCMEGTCFDLL